MRPFPAFLDFDICMDQYYIPNIQIVKLTRKELYDQIWSEPAVKLARKYGFSDVWLARICKKNNIPRPPRGYWARIESGQKVPKTPLPKGENRIIEIRVHDPGLKKEKTVSGASSDQKKRLKSIEVPLYEETPHPFISDTAKILEISSQDNTGLVPPQEGCININVSKESLSRALCIMDSLIKMLTIMGFEVSLSGNSTEVKIDDVTLNIALREELDRKRRLKASEHNLEGYYQFGYRLFDKRAYPTGKLIFSIDGLGFYSQCRRTWRDTDSQRLEDCLKGIVLGLIRVTELKKSHFLKEEEGREE